MCFARPIASARNPCSPASLSSIAEHPPDKRETAKHYRAGRPFFGSRIPVRFLSNHPLLLRQISASLKRRRRGCDTRLGDHSPSVNAKQLAHPALQAGPRRCKSGHGCHRSQGVTRNLHAALRRRRFVVQIHVRAPFSNGERAAARQHIRWRALSSVIRHSAFPISSAPVPQQPQGGFRKPVFVGASPTRGSGFSQDCGVTAASLPVKETARVRIPAS